MKITKESLQAMIREVVSEVVKENSKLDRDSLRATVAENGFHIRPRF